MKRRRTAAPHQPPKCREVPVEVMGVAPGLQRIDIVATEHQPVPAPPPSTPEQSGGTRWETIEDALAATKGPVAPDPWDRLTR